MGSDSPKKKGVVRATKTGRYVALPNSAKVTVKEVLSSKQKSRKFLKRAGITTSTGELSKHYKPANVAKVKSGQRKADK